MKKMLTLLAVATIPAMLGGCAACCPTGLCPCCPCNWFNRPAPCPPAPVYAAPLAANPCAPYPYAAAGMPQYVTPTAAPFTAAPTFVQPQQAACCPPQQPMYYQQAQPAYYAEPGCGYVESSCGGAYPGMVSYGPEMPVEYGPGGSGCCDGGAVGPPAPEAYIEPRPAGE